MKKTFSLLLALAMVLSLAACGGKDTPADDVDTPDTPAENNQPDTQLRPGQPCQRGVGGRLCKDELQ